MLSCSCSVWDSRSDERTPLAKAGHPLLATEGTARMIEGLGLTVRQITKRLSEGHPNVLDAIEQGWVGAALCVA